MVSDGALILNPGKLRHPVTSAPEPVRFDGRGRLLLPNTHLQVRYSATPTTNARSNECTGRTREMGKVLAAGQEFSFVLRYAGTGITRRRKFPNNGTVNAVSPCAGL
jgi:hypothetical protein